MKKVIFKTCSIFLLLFSLVLFSCSMYYIYSWHHQNKLIDYQLDKINDVIKINKTKNVIIESDSSDTKQTELIDVDFSELKKMNEYLSKRGPDEDGYYINEHVALGHKRLIVLDPNGR